MPDNGEKKESMKEIKERWEVKRVRVVQNHRKQRRRKSQAVM